jgi:hypothetical protein
MSAIMRPSPAQINDSALDAFNLNDSSPVIDFNPPEDLKKAIS